MPTINSNPSTTPTNPSTPSLPTPTAEPTTLSERYDAWAKDGWTDGELKNYVSDIIATGYVQPHLNQLWNAVLTPSMPAHAERDA